MDTLQIVRLLEQLATTVSIAPFQQEQGDVTSTLVALRVIILQVMSA